MTLVAKELMISIMRSASLLRIFLQVSLIRPRLLFRSRINAKTLNLLAMCYSSLSKDICLASEP